jgi:colanic acid/amylovoran biosynthesis protein
MRIIITNIVVLNGGDGAILFGMIKALRQAFGEDCEFIVFASEPQAAKRMYPEIDFRETLGLAATRAPQIRYLGRIIRTLRSSTCLFCAWCHARGLRVVPRLLLGAEKARNLATYANADLVVSSGGTYLKEEYGMGSQICDYRLTLLLGRPLVFYTQTLGPFTRGEYKVALRSIFNSAQAILLRDERSRKNLLDIGVSDSKIHLAADAAFALAKPAELETAARRKFPTSPARVVISVREWQHFKSVSNEEGMRWYVEAVVATVRQLVHQHGVEVTFLSTCQGNPEYDDDSKLATRIVATLDAATTAHIQVVRGFVRFDELMKRLLEFDLCIATRMHMCILALISGVPVLPIAYEFKTQELFAHLGLEKWVTDIESISADGFVDRVENFLKAMPELSGPVFQKVLELHYSAADSAAKIKSSFRMAV